MKRESEKKLINWKEKKKRKPLLITGARQCGKTYLMQTFGNEHFKNTLTLNFEKEPAIKEIFDYNLDPKRILNELGILKFGTTIDLDNTLIIFDEIQRCETALASLKYFEESELNMYLLCAGSLLGVELRRKNFSFPVGKVERLEMYPLSFYEFCYALGGEKYITALKDFDLYREIPSLIAEPMLKLLQLYYIIGGMPAVVKTYIESKDFEEVDKVLDDILKDYRDDFSQYANPHDVIKISAIWDSIPTQLAKENNKFVFSHIKESVRARDYEDALQWLVDAGLVYKLKKVSAPQIPLSSASDSTYFKVYMHDIGMLRKKSEISYKTIFTEPKAYSAYKGAFTENYCMTELINLRIRPYFWRSASTAELDFIFEDDMNRIIPLEAKSANNTKAKSFMSFCKRYDSELGFKVSTKNIGLNEKGKTRELSLPLYLLWKLKKYLN